MFSINGDGMLTKPKRTPYQKVPAALPLFSVKRRVKHERGSEVPARSKSSRAGAYTGCWESGLYMKRRCPALGGAIFLAGVPAALSFGSRRSSDLL